MFNFSSWKAVFPLHKNAYTVSGFKQLTDELPHYTDYSQGLRPVARCTVRSATRKTVVARVIEPLKLVLPYNLNSPGLHIHFWASDPRAVLVPSKHQQQEGYMWAANNKIRRTQRIATNKTRRTHEGSYKQNTKDTCRQLLTKSAVPARHTPKILNCLQTLWSKWNFTSQFLMATWNEQKD